MLYSIEEIITTLKTARQEKGLSQRALSAKIGIPQSHLSKIEQGGVDIQISSLLELARVLDLELVLVPRQLLSAVQALQQAPETLTQVPVYRLPDEEAEEHDPSY